MNRDLKADLIICRSAISGRHYLEVARAGWPEAIERAIAAEEIVKKYATSARTIALYLKEFCDTSLPYDEMIAEASRRADSKIAALTEENDIQRASIQQLSAQVVKMQGVVDAVKCLRDSYGKDAQSKMNAWHEFIQALAALEGGPPCPR